MKVNIAVIIYKIGTEKLNANFRRTRVLNMKKKRKIY
jgi:hypothetical protein